MDKKLQEGTGTFNQENIRKAKKDASQMIIIQLRNFSTM
jgi:hypothetical protein